MAGEKAAFLRNPTFWAVLVVVWAAVLYYLSSQSNLHVGPDIPQMDKVKHAVYFMGGATMLFLALRLRSSPHGLGTCLVAIVVFAAVIGALDEFHQSFTPGRSGNDVWDWLADVTGGLLATRLGPRVLAWLQ